MPLPERSTDESPKDFISRCMSDEKVNKEFPDHDRRLAVCMNGANANLSLIESMDLKVYFDSVAESEELYGFTEALNSDNWYVPAVYEECDEVSETWDISVAKPGLWENIRKKKEREGKDYKPAKKGDKDRPDPDAFKEAQSVFKYKNPKTGEIYEYQHRGIYKKDGVTLIPTKASEYQGRKVKLNKPFRTSNGPKKFAVYVKNEKGTVVIVRFGDPNMRIKKSDPARRKSFRARHKCDSPGPRWSARYWSCKMW